MDTQRHAEAYLQLYSDSVKRRQCVKYAQNLGPDAQKTKAMRQVTPEKSVMTH